MTTPVEKIWQTPSPSSLLNPSRDGKLAGAAVDSVAARDYKFVDGCT